ncbi:MAG TPA: TRL-like family protein [Polyangiales bacterium]
MESMLKNGLLGSLLLVAAALSGCITAASPVIGVLYTGAKHGDTATGVSNAGAKSGESCANSILGLVASGDASVATAAQKGGISTVSNVDHRTMSILGIYSEYCTVVYGQ